MPADTFLMIVLTVLGTMVLPVALWVRALKRIRDLEMTLVAQTADADRDNDFRVLLQQITAQLESLADNQARLANRLNDAPRQLPPAPLNPAQPVTPH